MSSIFELIQEGVTGREYSIQGWIRSVQEFGSLFFINLVDGSYLKGLQLVGNAEELKKSELKLGSAIEVSGVLVESKGKGQQYEFKLSELKILQKSFDDYPIQAAKLSLDYLRTQQSVRHRTLLFNAVAEIRRELVYSIYQFLYERGFYPAMPPILSTNSCEGGAELFKLDKNGAKFFKQKEVLLSVSGQFYCEALSNGLRNTFSFGPTFRAEASNSSSHLSEFWMLELEMAFTPLSELIEFVYLLFSSVVKRVLENCRDSLEVLGEKLFNDRNSLVTRLEQVVNLRYKVLDYTSAVSIVSTYREIVWGESLSREDEQWLVGHSGVQIVFLTNFPAYIKPFYMKRDGKETLSFDMLVSGIGEMAGGSEREADYRLLRSRVREEGLDLFSLEWYLDLRKFGYYQSSGFGLGFERLLSYVTGLKNVKDVSLFPRSYKNLVV